MEKKEFRKRGEGRDCVQRAERLRMEDSRRQGRGSMTAVFTSERRFMATETRFPLVHNALSGWRLWKKREKMESCVTELFLLKAVQFFWQNINRCVFLQRWNSLLPHLVGKNYMNYLIMVFVPLLIASQNFGWRKSDLERYRAFRFDKTSRGFIVMCIRKF